MKKYKRSELYQLLKSCNPQEICNDLCAEIDIGDKKLMQSGDRFIMNKMREKIARFKSTYASIVIINKDIPCLVIHKSKPDPNSELRSIAQIWIPFQGENVNQVCYLTYETRQILDLLSEDDITDRFTHRYYQSAKLI